MKKLILLAISTIFFYSCNPDEFLDVVPTGSQIPTTIEDFDKLLENPEPSYIGWANIVHMDPDILLTEELYNGLLYDFQRNQYRWSSELYLQNENDNSWKYRYKNIYVYNLIIQDINDAELGERTEEDRKVIKGQAYAQRAFSYFYLVNEYAPHYSDATLNTPAVPMPLQPDLTAQLPRSTVGEIYAQIEKDLNTAEPLLENFTAVDETNFRPGKASILGLRAWIALYKGDFEAAKTYADEALDLYNFMYDYTQFTLRTPGNTWSGLSTNELYFGTTTKDNVWAKYYNFSYNRPGMLYNPDLIPLYDQDNDYRFVLYANHFTYAGADVSPNFAYSRINSERQVGVTTPDLYMISAEGHARTGNTATAIERLNTLLDNRILNYTPMTSSDFSGDAALLQFIKDERRKEFFATGKTWFDMKRYHAYGESIPTFTRTIDGQTITLEPGSDKYVVPISPKIINQNPNL